MKRLNDSLTEKTNKKIVKETHCYIFELILTFF